MHFNLESQKARVGHKTNKQTENKHAAPTQEAFKRSSHSD